MDKDSERVEMIKNLYDLCYGRESLHYITRRNALLTYINKLADKQLLQGG